MGVSWQIRIYEHQRLVCSEICAGPLELGRQVVGEQGPFTRYAKGPIARLIIAELKVTDISRRHALLERQAGWIHADRESQRHPANRPGEWRAVGTPRSPAGATSNCAGDRQKNGSAPGGRGGDRQRTRPGRRHGSSQPAVFLAAEISRPERAIGAAADVNRQLLRWLQTSMGVFHSAASSADFFQKAAQAVVDIIGLDTGRVLLLEQDTWQTRAFASGSLQVEEENRRPSLTVLNKVRSEKRTFWELPSIVADQNRSLAGVNAVVATPLARSAWRRDWSRLWRSPAGCRLVGTGAYQRVGGDAGRVDCQRSGRRNGPHAARASRAYRPGPIRAVLHARTVRTTQPASRPAGRAGRRSFAAVLRYSRFQPHQRTSGSARDRAMDRRRDGRAFGLRSRACRSVGRLYRR